VDPHFTHLAEGNARQARKRVAADVLIRDEAGRVLVVDPTYKEGLDLPGGMVEANESPRAGALREIGEELGLTRVIGPPLVVEWIGAHGPWDDQIVFVLTAGS
jgi:8-oxo-dGTP diphosphatase